MRRIYIVLGRLSFYALWPLLWLYLRKTRRVYAVIRHKDEVLYIKNWLSDNSWRLPGGGVGMNETPKEALIRELREELGIEVTSSLQKITNGVTRSQKLGFAYDIYELEVPQKLGITAHRWEITDWGWKHVALRSAETQKIRGEDLLYLTKR